MNYTLQLNERERREKEGRGRANSICLVGGEGQKCKKGEELENSLSIATLVTGRVGEGGGGGGGFSALSRGGEKTEEEGGLSQSTVERKKSPSPFFCVLAAEGRGRET